MKPQVKMGKSDHVVAWWSPLGPQVVARWPPPGYSKIHGCSEVVTPHVSNHVSNHLVPTCSRWLLHGEWPFQHGHDMGAWTQRWLLHGEWPCRHGHTWALEQPPSPHLLKMVTPWRVAISTWA